MRKLLAASWISLFLLRWLVPGIKREGRLLHRRSVIAYRGGKKGEEEGTNFTVSELYSVPERLKGWQREEKRASLPNTSAD